MYLGTVLVLVRILLYKVYIFIIAKYQIPKHLVSEVYVKISKMFLTLFLNI